MREGLSNTVKKTPWVPVPTWYFDNKKRVEVFSHLEITRAMYDDLYLAAELSWKSTVDNAKLKECWGSPYAVRKSRLRSWGRNRYGIKDWDPNKIYKKLHVEVAKFLSKTRKENIAKKVSTKNENVKVSTGLHTAKVTKALYKDHKLIVDFDLGSTNDEEKNTKIKSVIKVGSGPHYYFLRCFGAGKKGYIKTEDLIDKNLVVELGTRNNKLLVTKYLRGRRKKNGIPIQKTLDSPFKT